MAYIKSIRKIYSDGRHNAFTDMEYWKGYYYVAFRNAGRHAVPGDYGDIFVIRSQNLKEWDICVRLTSGDDHDNRDPALLDMGDELGVFFGASFSKVPGELLYQSREKDRTVRGFQSYASFTSNGTTWSAPQPVYEPNMWLWQVEGFKGVYYGTVENAERKFRLVRSTDGRNWETISEIPPNRFKSTEAGLWVTEDGMMHIVIRADGNTDMALLARSKPPYNKWDLKELNYTVHSPVIRPVGDELWVAGRAYGKQLPSSMIPPEPPKEKVEALACLDERLARPQEWHVAVWRLVGNHLEPILVLPSRGDNAYPGMVVETGKVLVSYYSQHDVDNGPKPKPGECPSEIYLAEIVNKPQSTR